VPMLEMTTLMLSLIVKFTSYLVKKTDRPLLLHNEWDRQVQEYIKEMRSRGTAVSSSVVIAAAAKGIIMNKDAHILRENGIKLTKEWAFYWIEWAM